MAPGMRGVGPRGEHGPWSDGYRNAAGHGLLAPTGTIGLLMDCDTTGIEPDFALVKFKKLAGGGYFKIVNQSVLGSAQGARLQQPGGPGDRLLRFRDQQRCSGHRTSTGLRSRSVV